MSEIKIACPECRQSFVVSEELLGEPVECGSCQHYFNISRDNQVKMGRDYFPGEKAKNLEVFQRKAPESLESAPVNFQAADYAQFSDPNAVMPMSPMRLLCIFGGLIGMGLVIFLFVAGSGDGGILTDVPNQKRWFLVGFAALIGSLLVLYGFVKYRILGVILTLCFVGGLVAMPIIYPERLTPVASQYNPEEVDLEMHVDLTSEDELRFKSEIGYATVETQIEEAEHPERVIAFVLKRSKPVHLETIKKYLAQSLITAEIPRVYEGRKLQNEPATLIIYNNARISIDDAADFAKKFSEDIRVREELQLIEIEVNVDALTTADAREITDESHPDYHSKNLEELRSIDPTRQLAAIQRLGNTKDIKLRSDIVRQLLVLLTHQSGEHRAEIVDTLRTWAIPDDGADEIITEQARERIQVGLKVPESYLHYLVEQNVEGIGDILVYAWAEDVIVYEELMLEAGERAEQGLLTVWPELDNYQLESAATILAKVGTAASIPALSAAYEKSGGELKKTLKATIDEIQSRR
ncbi:hypothetical protein ACFPK9_11295 [Rubritalea spongiae]|uniref:HEAT repeat domain-containing protein n=1 Tax=Rubritalea spongiae TaxID=430797 RepID=A0ABW5DYF6_9BACT